MQKKIGKVALYANLSVAYTPRCSMQNALKFILAIIGISLVAGGILYTVGLMSFQGSFDKKYTREVLIENFVNHEQEFLDVVNFFRNNIPGKRDYSVSFWQKGKNSVSLYLYPHVIDPKNKIIGASDVAVDSPKLDSVLRILGWSKLTLTNLRDKLQKTNCNYIGNVEYNDNKINLSPDQAGWGSFTYTVWDRPIVDSLVSTYGSPLGSDSFAIRVVLNYSSAL